MLRTFVVRKATDLQSLRSALLDARLRPAQTDAALEQLKALNPHADLNKISAGTVLFIPDARGFKTSAGTPTPAGPLEDFRDLASGALSDAARKVRSANAARAAERADVAAILKSAAFRRIVGADKDLAQQSDAAQKALADEEERDKQADEILAATSKAALAALAQISKLAG